MTVVSVETLEEPNDGMSFLHAVRHLWNLKLNLAILFRFCHACSGMPKVLLNDKLTISSERNE